MSAPARGQLGRSALVGIAVAAVAIVVGAILLLPPPSPTAVSPTQSPPASPTSSPTPSAMASPTASPTVSPSPTVASRGYVNAELGYSIDMPAPWHRGDCGSFTLRDFGRERDARDEFIPIPDYDHRPSGTGSMVDQIYVFARSNEQRLTPRTWEQAGKIGFSMGRILEDVTFAGRPALRAGGSAEFELFLVAEGQFMFEVGHAGSGGQTTAASRAAILRTFRFLTAEELRAARAAPTPQPPAPRSPEEVADALADGFAQRDIATLRSVLTMGCVTHGFWQSEGTGMDDARYLDELRGLFSQGLTVTVQPRPLTGDRSGSLPTLHVRSQWRQPGQADRDIDLMISPEGATWYWRGTLTYPPGSR
jgi:hypothetical protein